MSRKAIYLNSILLKAGIFSLFLLGVIAQSKAQLSDAIRFRLTNSSSGQYDETVIRFVSGASESWDSSFDAYKLFSNSPSVTSLYTQSAEGYNLSINTYPELSQDYQLKLYAYSPQGGNFTLSKQILGSFGNDVYISIKDMATNTYHHVNALPLNIQLPASMDTLEVFEIVFSVPPTVSLTSASCSDTNTGGIEINDPGNSTYSYVILDSAENTVLNSVSSSSVSMVDGLATGNYTLQLNDETGESHTVAMEVPSLEPLKLATSVSDASCTEASDGSITVDMASGVAPYSIDWANRSESPWTLNGLEAGSYQAIVTDGNGCSTKQTIEVKAKDPQLAIGLARPDSQFTEGEPITFQNVALDKAQSFWQIGSDMLEGNKVTYTFTTAGQQNVYLEGINGQCFDLDTLAIKVAPKLSPIEETPTGQLEIAAENWDISSRNGGINLSIPTSHTQQKVETHIYDLRGDLIAMETMHQGQESRIELPNHRGQLVVVQIIAGSTPQGAKVYVQ